MHLYSPAPPNPAAPYPAAARAPVGQNPGRTRRAPPVRTLCTCTAAPPPGRSPCTCTAQPRPNPAAPYPAAVRAPVRLRRGRARRALPVRTLCTCTACASTWQKPMHLYSPAPPNPTAPYPAAARAPVRPNPGRTRRALPARPLCTCPAQPRPNPPRPACQNPIHLYGSAPTEHDSGRLVGTRCTSTPPARPAHASPTQPQRARASRICDGGSAVALTGGASGSSIARASRCSRPSPAPAAPASP